jgi:hypothetical protein
LNVHYRIGASRLHFRTHRVVRSDRRILQLQPS